MKWKDFLERWELTSLKVNVKILQAEFKPNIHDRQCAWELYVELLTRITTQPLNENDGDEETALTSIYSLFDTTRTILKEHGRECLEFNRLSITVLNQKIRPFTAKWHKESLNDGFKNREKCVEFRQELSELQIELKNYTQALAKIADVEDLTEISY